MDILSSCIEPISDIIGCQFFGRDSQPNLRLYVRSNRFYTISKMSEYKVDYDYYLKFYNTSFDNSFKDGEYILFTGIQDPYGKFIKRDSPDTQVAYVKAYFLYEYLFKILGVTYKVTTQDIADSLKICRHTLERITWRLHQDNILHVNTEDHSRSIKQYVSLKKKVPKANVTIEPYKYEVFNTVYSLGYCSSSNQVKSNSQLISNRTLSSLYTNQFCFDISASAMPPLFYMAGGTPAVLENPSDLTTPVVIVDYMLSEYIYDVVDRCLHPVPFEVDISSPSLHVIRANKDYQEESEKDGRLEEEELIDQDIPDYIYVPPYEELVLKGVCATSKTLMQNGNTDPLRIWERKHTDKAKLTTCHRLWHPFHSLRREYRKCVHYNGSPLIEAMDVHNCFYTLFAKRLECEVGFNHKSMYGIPQEEYDRYAKIVRDGTFYEDVLNRAYDVGGQTIDECYCMMDDVTDAPHLGKTRDEVKVELQAYRNILKMQQARACYTNIDDYMIKNFPYIRYFLFDYRTYRKEVFQNGKLKTKEVKCLQRDICHVETYLISKVCFKLNSLGVTPFSLHDGIFLSEDDMENLRSIWGESDIEATKHHVEAVFWKHYDELQPDIVLKMMNE